MWCAVYKSSRRQETYLYVERRDDFSKVPSFLLDQFGKPVFVLTIDLARRDHLALADIEEVRRSLSEKGFYLQLPPPVEDLLGALRRSHGLPTDGAGHPVLAESGPCAT